MDKKTLVEIFSEIGHFGNDIGLNDKNSTHSYLEIYDRLFEPYRNNSTILEIGLAMGDSLKLWDTYFDNSTIVGVDVSIVFQRAEYKNNVRIIQEDGTKPLLLEHLKEFMFDLVIDDGDHLTQSQVDTFNLLKPKMKKGSLYVIEDLLALDTERKTYEALYDSVEIIDLRHIKGRFDDALVLIRI